MRVPAQQSNYDHLAGSTPLSSAPNNYDRLGPRGEANSDGYYEAAAITGAEAPVYHTTQSAAEPASGRCALLPPHQTPCRATVDSPARVPFAVPFTLWLL